MEAAVRFTTIHGGYQVVERCAVLESLREIYGDEGLALEPRPFPSHSDASVLWGAGMQTILFGPGDLERAQAPEKWVSLSQVCRAAGIYLELMRALAR